MGVGHRVLAPDELPRATTRARSAVVGLTPYSCVSQLKRRASLQGLRTCGGGYPYPYVISRPEKIIIIILKILEAPWIAHQNESNQNAPRLSTQHGNKRQDTAQKNASCAASQPRRMIPRRAPSTPGIFCALALESTPSPPPRETHLRHNKSCVQRVRRRMRRTTKIARLHVQQARLQNNRECIVNIYRNPYSVYDVT